MQDQTLTIVTWNVGMLVIRRLSYVIVEPAPYKDIRLRHLPRALRQCRANIVALQELYEPRDVAYVVDKTRKRFPYYAEAETPKTSSRLPPGLVVLSEYPILKSTFYPFDVLTPDEAIFVWKGMLHCTIDAGPFGILEVINTHNTSGGMLWSPRRWLMHQIRKRQYRQMFEIFRRFPYAPRIALGDFNASPECSSESYQELLQPNFHDAWNAALQKRKPTWDPQNPLNAGGPHGIEPAECLDGFHIDDNLLRAAKISHIDIVFQKPTVQGPNDLRLTVSDHYGVEMKLALKETVTH